MSNGLVLHLGGIFKDDGNFLIVRLVDDYEKLRIFGVLYNR